jgi:hypothetical protein
MEAFLSIIGFGYPDRPGRPGYPAWGHYGHIRFPFSNENDNPRI